jgi:hypothetical protein
VVGVVLEGGLTSVAVVGTGGIGATEVRGTGAGVRAVAVGPDCAVEGRVVVVGTAVVDVRLVVVGAVAGAVVEVVVGAGAVVVGEAVVVVEGLPSGVKIGSSGSPGPVSVSPPTNNSVRDGPALVLAT